MQYRHFKGGLYTHIAEATLVSSKNDTCIKAIVYKDENQKIWVKPESEFFDMVQMPTPDGFGLVQRYQKIFCKVCGEPLDECRAGHSQKETCLICGFELNEFSFCENCLGEGLRG